MSEIGFRHFAQRDRDRTAIVDPRGRSWSRGELLDLIDRTAGAFAAAGLSPEDVVAIVAPNCAEYLAVYLAGIEAGLYVVPVNWHLAEQEIAFILADSGAKAIVAHGSLGAIRLASLFDDSPKTTALISIGDAAGFTSLDAFIALRPAVALAGRSAGRVMPYTSATTGRPKAVRRPLQGAERALHKTVQWHLSLGIEIEQDNVHLCASMLYHSAPLEGAVIAMHMGHEVVLVDRWDPQGLLQLIQRYAVTTTFMVPAMFVRLLKLPSEIRGAYSTSSLRFVIHAGAPCPVDVKRRMIEWWGPIVWESYGAAEAQGAVVSPTDWLAHPGTVGRAIPGSRLKILDDDGRELAPGEVGLIYMTPHTGDHFEYNGDPEKTLTCRRGEFVTVGDIGYLNEDGYLFICDRKTDMIISSGMNIYPAEIEQVLVQHPAVTDCAVVGVAHELMGEVPKAVVQLASGLTPGPQLTADILRFLAERVSPMKLPKRVEYADRIPRDPNGKLYRRLLRDEAAKHAR
jgi:long-chain acyl-CoA synthetase